jgi:hypothetical protein
MDESPLSFDKPASSRIANHEAGNVGALPQVLSHVSIRTGGTLPLRVSFFSDFDHAKSESRALMGNQSRRAGIVGAFRALPASARAQTLIVDPSIGCDDFAPMIILRRPRACDLHSTAVAVLRSLPPSPVSQRPCS